MSRVSFILGIIILCLLGLGGFFAVNFFQNPQTLEDYSNQDALMAITRDRPAYLNNDGKSVIEVVSLKQPEKNWYIATIKSIHDDSMKVPVKIVLTSQSNHILTMVLGPDTYFTESELLKHNVPDSVILELQKS